MMRHVLRRCMICIPVTWLICALVFLNYEAENRQQVDTEISIRSIEKTSTIETPPTTSSSTTTTTTTTQKSSSEGKHVVHPEIEQINAPVINESKFDPNGPGEMGQGIELKRNELLPNDLRKYEEELQKHAFNVYASNLMSVHRSLPDVRDSGCRKIEYKAPILTAGVVMCFHNEAWSILLRSLHSIIDRSPPEMLKEIILVDDFSDMDHLKDQLDEYVKDLKIVTIIRQKKREGLIRSRLIGAATIKSDVIVFLDSHIEAADGWLPPLVDPISQNWTTVMTPVIDVISDETLKFNFGTADSVIVGGFDWNLVFTWHALPERVKRKRKHFLDPVESPTMAGGLFAISKKYFEYLGTYDAGMDIWGGENLEISFRIWMCGGLLLTAPCSHVGHIFRKRSPYKWKPGENVIRKNNIRLAEVWLDDYKKFYYERFNYELGTYGDITSRKLLRQKLECKSFDWYLENIYPELFIPSHAIASGDIRNVAAVYCIDGSTGHRDLNKAVIGYPCHQQGGNQYFMLSPMGEIRRDDGCLDYPGGMQDIGKNDKVITFKCHGQEGNQRWQYSQYDQLIHVPTKLCLALSNDNRHLQMQRCDTENARQQWLWKRKKLNETKNA